MHQIGPYTLLDELARGGHGVVYRARDSSGRVVALKLLLAHRAANLGARRRFQLEVQTLTRLRHPGVVSILATGEHEGAPWLALDFVEGETLQERLRRGPLALDEAIHVGHQLAQALTYVHACGVVHRDLKPDNVLLRGRDALLTDFGIALDVDASTSRLTATGVSVGTPGYWSPEQARGASAKVGPHSDVYSLGGVLYACLTGNPPVQATTLQEYLQRAHSRVPPSPRKVRAEVPEWLNALCARCLAVEPSDRPGSAEEVARALLAGERGALAPRAGGGRRGLLLAIGLGGVLALGLGVALLLTQREDTTPPELTIDAPPAGARLAGTGTLEVRGVARDAGGPVEVSVDSVSSRVGPEGAFVLTVGVGPGEQELRVVARDAAGNASEAVLRFDYVEVPAWYLALPDGERAPLPLGEGLSWGEEPGDYVHTKDGTLLRWIPAGSFRMGSDVSPFTDERPTHEVTFAEGFFLGKYETTIAQYRNYCEGVGQPMPLVAADTRGFGGSYSEPPDSHPMFGVSWDVARAYCNWAGLRLPSEAEWEYAARGPTGRRFPWGNEEPDATRANVADASTDWDWPDEIRRNYGFAEAPYDDGFPATAPVGSFPRGVSQFGCYDMAGNVYEWVQDTPLAHYRGAPSDGSALEEKGEKLRGFRGGGWFYPARFCRSADRDSGNPETGGAALGFRPARSGR